MKKVLATVLALVFSVSLFVFAGIGANAAKEIVTKTYNIPLRTTPPVVDGNGSDAAWEGAYTVEMSIAALKNGGFIKNIGKAEGATGTVKMVWSNSGSAAGLYFLCQVNDPTNGWAVDMLGDGPYYEQLGDGLQIFIDPLYQRKTTAKNSAMRFNFVPYRSHSGNGMCPTDSEGWWESWIWSGNQSSSGVNLKASLVSVDDDGSGPIDRVKIVSAYTMEIFIPWMALQLNHAEPPAGNLYDKMGLGLALHDTDWSYDIWYQSCYGSGSYVFNPSPSILEVNYIADFSKNGKEAISFPRYYNTIVLADANGAVPGGEGGSTPTTESGESTATTETDTQKVEALDALTNSIVSAKSEYLENDARDTYTEDSMLALSDAVAKGEGMSESNTLEEITAAKSAIDEAVSALAKKEDASPSDTTKDDAEQAGTAVEESSGMPLGAIIGIIVGVVVVLAAAAVVVVLLLKKKKAAQPEDNSQE